MKGAPSKTKPKAKRASRVRRSRAPVSKSSSARKAKRRGSIAASRKAKRGASRAASRKPRAGEVILLSGGNPQIAKGDGDAPVQAYIAAMPGWKRDVGKRLDALIVRNVPDVKKAVRWNSPFFGTEGRDYFVSFHVFTQYIKVTFFNGLSLRPVPPGGTEKSGKARWIDVYEGQLDEPQMASWVKQAAALPGWDLAST